MAGRRAREAKIYRDPRWRDIRADLLAPLPDGRPRLCADCHLAPATAVHHVRGLADGGAPFDRSNLVPLCGFCHQERHRDADPDRTAWITILREQMDRPPDDDESSRLPAAGDRDPRQDRGENRPKPPGSR